MSDIRKPDVQTVLVTRADGGVTVLRVVENEYVPDPRNPGERVLSQHYDITPAYVDSLIAKYVDSGCWVGGQVPVSWRFVPNDYVDEQTDRYFRNAWLDDGNGKPGVDMPKAREIHRERLREMRQPLLDALDFEYLKADETGNLLEKQSIAVEKQALRDVTADPAIDAAQTPEELKAVIPEALKSSDTLRG